MVLTKEIRRVIILFIVLVLHACSNPVNTPGNDPANTPDNSPPLRYIHAIQGDARSSPMRDERVTVEAIVTGDFEGISSQRPQLKGFFIQEEDSQKDNNPDTSEGIFVNVGSFGNRVSVGDKVRITATVKETYSMTVLASPQIEVLSNGEYASSSYSTEPSIS